MSTISASTTSTTAYKVTADTTGTLVFQTGASPTTAMTLGSDQSVTFAGAQTYTGAATFTTGISVQGLTVGKGAGAVSTNTAVGASALAANTTGLGNTSVGYAALDVSTSSDYHTAVGWNSLGSNTTGARNTAFGAASLATNSTGGYNVAMGVNSGYAITTGSYNVALGYDALSSNTTASNNTAVGYQALYSNTVAQYNVAIGNQALYTYNRTADTTGRNIAVGFQTLYSLTTGQENVAIGLAAGFTNSTGTGNIYIGEEAGYYATGSKNCFVGYAAGNNVTTGAKNTILGQYSGNQGGLDIRTASNYIVLSDGDGNPQAYCDGASWNLGLGGVGSNNYGRVNLYGSSASGYGSVIFGYGNGAEKWAVGAYSAIVGGANTNYLVCRAAASGGVYLSNGATSWTAVSDERLKDIIEPITNAVSKVSTLRAVIGKYKTDEENKRRSFLIAQDVQAVLPEAVTSCVQSKEDDTEYLGVAYSDVIPLLVAAIKELKAEIDTLKGQA